MTDRGGEERAYLALADGTLFEGLPFGRRGRRTGEVVFNTSMTGYQEVLTDPSYCRQITVMTAPHIGNTGVNDEDDESDRVWLAGFAVRHASPTTSSWRATGGLDAYLSRHGVPGITGLDTRAIVRRIRSEGAMAGALVNDGSSAEEAMAMAREAPDINALDLVGEVTCAAPYAWREAADPAWYPLSVPGGAASDAGAQSHIVVLDLGVKRNTLRLLAARGCRVTVVPARTSPDAVMALAPDGLLVSNGPGDPALLPDVAANLQALLGRLPVFGICLGHQVLGLALGGHTYKLKFGHRGGNQPVGEPGTDRVQITSHNHGFGLSADGLPPDAVVTRVNLNDGCVEGLAVPGRMASSVQYHPEAAPGPHDAEPLFDRFLDRVSAARSG